MTRTRMLYITKARINHEMRKSKAKQAIIDTAQKLIEKKGYSNLNINEVAYVAKVSVGTLYYHFPKGKLDILAEILSQRVEGFIEATSEKMKEAGVLEGKMSVDDTLRWLFKTIIELRRKDRHFLAAIQSELLNNPDDYVEFVKKYHHTDGVQRGMGILAQVVGDMTKDTSSSLKQKLEGMQSAIGLLMTYQIIFPGYMGEDDDFVELAVKVFMDMMRN